MTDYLCWRDEQCDTEDAADVFVADEPEEAAEAYIANRLANGDDVRDLDGSTVNVSADGSDGRLYWTVGITIDWDPDIGSHPAVPREGPP